MGLFSSIKRFFCHHFGDFSFIKYLCDNNQTIKLSVPEKTYIGGYKNKTRRSRKYNSRTRRKY